MTHKCNLCRKEMLPVEDIDVRGFLIRGFRCECGNEHGDPEDIDNIVRYFRKLKNGNITTNCHPHGINPRLLENFLIRFVDIKQILS